MYSTAGDHYKESCVKVTECILQERICVKVTEYTSHQEFIVKKVVLMFRNAFHSRSSSLRKLRESYGMHVDSGDYHKERCVKVTECISH